MTIPGYSVTADMETFLKSGSLTAARTNLGIVQFTDVVSGIVPASGGGTTNFLRADGTWAAPGGGGATNLGYTASTRLLTSDTGTDVTLPIFTATDAGLVSGSGGGTTNYLRADGSWAAPPGIPVGTNLSYTAATRLLASDTGADVTLPIVTSADAGLAPASGGGTTNFLRADGNWAAPPVTDLAYTASTRLLASSTGADVTLPLFTSTDAGLTPSSGGGTTNYLRADGSWAAPPGGAGTTNLSYTAATRVLASDTGTDATLPLATSTDAGLTPASGGGTTNFLRADMTWAAPPAGSSDTLIYNRLTGTYVLTSTVAAQKLFNWSTNGAVQVDTGLWLFRCIFTITGLSATSGNLQFQLVGGGTATIDSVTYHGIGIDNNTPTNAGAQGGSFSYASNSAASIITAGTGTGVGVNVMGFFRCTAAGTIIPSIALVTAAAGTVAAGSCFYARRVTSSTTIAQGTWT